MLQIIKCVVASVVFLFVIYTRFSDVRVSLVFKYFFCEGSSFAPVNSLSEMMVNYFSIMLLLFFSCFLKYLRLTFQVLIKPFIYPLKTPENLLFSYVFRKYRFAKYTRTRVPSDPFFPYKNRIVASVVKRENTGQGKPVIWHILRNVSLKICVTQILMYF